MGTEVANSFGLTINGSIEGNRESLGRAYQWTTTA